MPAHLSMLIIFHLYLQSFCVSTCAVLRPTFGADSSGE